MIQELKIQNFLSFKDEVTFSFEATSDTKLDDYYIATQPDGTRLLKMAMIYGANASGKSNLIKAFEFIKKFVHEIPEETDTELPFVPFMFDKTKDEPGKFTLVFYDNGVKHKYQLIVNDLVVFEEKLFFYPSTQPAIIFNRYFNKKDNLSVLEFGPKIKVSEQAIEAIQLKTLKNTSVFAARNQVNVSIPELDRINEWFAKNFITPINPYHSLTTFSDEKIKNDTNIKKHALKFLSKADFNITDVLFEETIHPITDEILKTLDATPLSEEDKAQIRKEKAVHLEETIFTHRIIKNGKEEFHNLSEERQSKGTMRYYGLSAPYYFAMKYNAFLPIDEIGSALHILLVFHLVNKFLQESDQAQLLFTTHNISLLNEKDILRKDAIWFAEKREDGATELFSMAEFPIRKELSYYNAYKHGKFGAIPEFD